MGAYFGSFFSLAIYRLPIKKSIVHGRSFCPNCNHRLEFLDLIPIFSYLFLRGKCRYCKEKIRERYILLELFSAVAFLLFALSLKIDIYNLDTSKIVYLFVGFMYLSALFIIGGIEKETHTISKPVLIFGLVVKAIYMIYLYILGINIYRYVIYILIAIIFIIFMSKKQNYTLQILNLCLFLSIIGNEQTAIFSILLTLLFIALSNLINKKNIKNKDAEEIIPIGFYLCYSNIISIILYNFIFIV